MAADIKTVLTRLLAELNAEEEKELLEALKGKRLTSDELLAAIRELPPESRKEVREALSEVKEDLDDPNPNPDPNPTPNPNPNPTPDPDPDPKRKTRQGRKAGRAYDWDVVDGKIVYLNYAKVYSGEDEPEEVDLLVDDEDDDDDDEDDD